MHITLNATLPITIINTHIPQAERPEDEKLQIYNDLRHIINKCRNKGPTYLIGDMNARIQKAEGRMERECIGPNTFEPESARVGTQSENVQQNRDLLIELCQDQSLRLMNTFFHKPDHKLVTYRAVGTTIDADFHRGTHEQLDFVATTERWKNTVKDAETDTEANIETDHYPLKARLQVKFKGCRKHNKTRPKYTECTEAQNKQLNESIQQLCAPSGGVRRTPNVNTQTLQQLTRTLPRQKAKLEQQHFQKQQSKFSRRGRCLSTTETQSHMSC